MSVTKTVGPDIGIPEGHAADADTIIEAIERPTRWEPTPQYDERLGRFVKADATEWRWLPKMELPGFGDPYESCGDDMPRFCSCCGGTVVVGRTCRRSTCRRCARRWCMQAATSVVSKLESVWAYQYAALKAHPFYHHLVISPPDEWKLDGDKETIYWRSLDVVKDILDELGVAGIPIYHPYRGSDEQPGDDLGEWKNRVFADRDWSDVKGELKFSPHFHVLGVSPHVDISVTERVHDKTGWVIHRITRDSDNVSIGNSYDLARAAAYCLSHCGIYEDSNGDMSAAYHPRVSERVPEGTPTPSEETAEESDRIVRSVAPKVLDVEYQAVSCTDSVSSDVAADRGVSLGGESDSDGSDSDGSDSSGDGDGDGSATVECNGRMEHITKAPAYLNDSDWRQKAPAAANLEKTYHEWKRENGIS